MEEGTIRTVREQFAKLEKLSKSYFSEQDRMKTFNELPGKLKEFNCTICKNKGVVASLNDSKDGLVMRNCKCMRVRAAINLIKKSGIKFKDLKDFDVTTGFQKAMLAIAVEYIKSSKDNWLYISGAVGSGKTMICLGILKAIMEQELVGADCLNWRETIGDMKYGGDELIKRYSNVELLYIDDFLKGKTPTEADFDVAYKIINHRYVDGLKTIFSSEHSLDSVCGLEASIGSRIYEKSKNFNLHIDDKPDRNYRMKDVISV